MAGVLGSKACHARRTARVAGAAPWLACSVLLSVGCEPRGGEQEPLDGDPVMYAEEVQPLVREHCGYLGCHGREGTPLTLYAVDHLRLRDPAGELDSERPALDEHALSEAELDHNRRAIAARWDPQGGEALVRRLLPESEGGIAHADVVVFEDPDAPALAVFRRFMRSVK